MPRPASARHTRSAAGRATQARIIKIATRLFASLGFEGTSLRQVASEAGIDISTLKYHFGDKENLYDAVYRSGYGEIATLIAGITGRLADIGSRDDVREAIRWAVTATYAHLSAHRDYSRLIVQRMLAGADAASELEREVQSEAMAALSAIFSSLAERGLIRDLDVGVLVSFLIASVPTWFEVVQGSPDWLGEGDDVEGRVASFFVMALEAVLLG